MYDSIHGRCYAPQCNIHENTEVVYLFPEEIAALDLIDIQQLDQEEAALRIGVSRKTIWRDVHEGRRKMADAIIHGKVIVMKECSDRGERCMPKAESDHVSEDGRGGLPPSLRRVRSDG